VTGVACSQGSGSSGSGAGFNERTGSISLKLASVPSDVLCIELDTSDWMSPQTFVSTAPGAPLSIAISPITPGWIDLYGRAYRVDCNTVRYGGGGIPGPGSDGGSAAASEISWIADPIWLQVIAGGPTEADLRFHQLGALDVNVDWSNCDPDGGAFACGTVDAGPTFADGG